MIKPVPQFTLTGNLFYLQSRRADQYSKRDLKKIPEKLESLGVESYKKRRMTRIRTPPSFNTNDFAPRQTKEGKTRVPADSFVALWFGAMGACLQRA